MTSSVRFPSVAFDQPASRVARPFGDSLGRHAEKGGERNDGCYGQHEKKRVSVGAQDFNDDHDWHEGQQPQ